MSLSDYKSEIWATLFNLLYVRIALTAVLVAWGVFISLQYTRTDDPVKQEKLKYLNFIWTGSGKMGIFMTLFWIWVITIVAVSAYPVLKRALPGFFGAHQ